MTELADLSGFVFMVTVMYNDLRDFQVQYYCTKQQVKITKGVEIAKVMAVGDNLLGVIVEKNLCSTKGIFQWLAQQI